MSVNAFVSAEEYWAAMRAESLAEAKHRDAFTARFEAMERQQKEIIYALGRISELLSDFVE